MRVRRALLSACVDTIINGPNFFVLNSHNGHSCRWKSGWERVRLARAGLLAGCGAGTLERLEMAAQKPGYLAYPTQAASRSERGRTRRRFAFRRQTRTRDHSTFFQSDSAR